MDKTITAICVNFFQYFLRTLRKAAFGTIFLKTDRNLLKMKLTEHKSEQFVEGSCVQNDTIFNTVL